MAANPESGALIADQYRIEAPLGEGTSSVFSATHLTTGRRVAIKWRSSSDDAQAAASLEHPNIVAVFDAGSHDGTPYVVMEYLEGESLADRLSRGPMPVNECLPTLIEAAHGIAAAHACGLVHGHLEPASIFLCADPPQVKVLGFDSAHGLDPHADVYALAAITYEALSGQEPHPATPEPLSQLVPDLPPHVETVVSRALSREHVAILELLEGLQPWAATTPAPLLEPEAPTTTLSAAIWTETTEVDALPLPTAQRRPWVVVAGFVGLSLATLVAGIAWAGLQPPRAQPTAVAPPVVPEPTTERETPTPQPMAAMPAPAAAPEPPRVESPARPKPEKRKKARAVQHKTSGVSLADF